MMLIVSGCIVAGMGDMAFSASGYATALVCAALQVRVWERNLSLCSVVLSCFSTGWLCQASLSGYAG